MKWLIDVLDVTSSSNSSAVWDAISTLDSLMECEALTLYIYTVLVIDNKINE